MQKLMSTKELKTKTFINLIHVKYAVMKLWK